MTDYYDVYADRFLESTRDVDMKCLRNRFLAALPKSFTGKSRILDAGTGSGRDALAFQNDGYLVSAFDASPSMVRAAMDHSGIPVRQMRFESFEWEHPFEGIWACASLLHVACADLTRVMRNLSAHLVAEGVLYASFKLGEGERQSEGRRFTDMTEITFSTHLDECRELRQIDVWRTEDRRVDKSDQSWLNVLLRKA